MKVVIDIPENDYWLACNYPDALISIYAHYIKKGIPLPEKHGDLIDRDALVKDLTNGIKAGLLLDGYEEYQNINSADDCVECVKFADTVIEAEGEDT